MIFYWSTTVLIILTKGAEIAASAGKAVGGKASARDKKRAQRNGSIPAPGGP